MTSIAILHYASPPVVGGVESTIFYHATGLASLGHQVKILSGAGAPFDDRIETVIDPLLGSMDEEVLAVKRDLDHGTFGEEFDGLVERLRSLLQSHLADCDVCIAHNILTFNKNLPLTTALYQVVQTSNIRLIGWCHDLAWSNPQYLPELHSGYPWNLLRKTWEKTKYVTVSEPRRIELAELLNLEPAQIEVVVPGVDPAQFLHWTPVTTRLDERLGLMDADGILLLPARLTRRKNIGLGLQVLAKLRERSGKDFRLIITGPPGPHNPANPGYLGELLELRRALGVEAAAHFIYAYGDGNTPLVPDNATMANLYQLADALFFPSFQEGFGIPVLEAGLVGIPIFCSDIPPFRQTGGDHIHYFDPTDEAPDQIAARLFYVLEGNPTYHLRVRVRQMYRWERIIRHHVLPLI